MIVVVLAIGVLGVMLAMLVMLASTFLDSYRGFDRMSDRISYAQSKKLLHDRCHKGSGLFCDTCLEYKKCTAEFTAKVKKEIDEYVERKEGKAE